MHDLVSVVIPTYNRGDLIRQTIESVLNQTYTPFEVIIVDDGSSDDTEQIINAMDDSRIKYCKIEHHGFPAPVRNAGIRMANGKYIAMLDSDDIWLKGKLKRQMREFELNPRLKLVSGDMEYMIREKSKILNLKKNVMLSFEDLLKHNLILNSTVVFKKEVTQSIGFLDDRADFKSIEDYDYWLRISNQYSGSCLILKECLGKYRVHETNISAITRPLSLLIELRKLFWIFKKYKEKYNNLVEESVYLRLEHARLNLYYLRLKTRVISLIDFFRYEKITPLSKLKGLIFYFFNRMSKIIKFLSTIDNKRVYI